MNSIKVGDRVIDNTSRTFVVAEMSGNHNKDFGRAKEIIDAAAEAGADAIKLQTYTPDTITLDCDNEYFQSQKGSLWEGQTLYDLYLEAYTPWEWQEELFKYAEKKGILCFSAPFDISAVEFLEKLNNPVYKIASYEIQDLMLIENVAKTGKPIIMSTGIATLEEINEAINVCYANNNKQVILLKCTSAYPSPYEDMNINVIPDMQKRFDCICGLSDHTLGSEVAIAAVAKGAKVIEKHFTLARADGGVDSAFSMEPKEFSEMVKQIRNVEKALGQATYDLTEKQIEGRKYGRSLFISTDIAKGEEFSSNNIKSVRPADGLPTKYYNEIIGKRANRNLIKGTPLSWDMID